MSQQIIIARSGTQPASSGSGQYFTGSVRVQPLFDAKEPARANGASVTFEPGARTAWHTHPLGQTLVITAGEGRVQRWGERAEVIRAGDVVWIPPDVKHWHGAGPTTRMTHIAIQEHLGGKNVEWLDHVAEDDYRQSTAENVDAHLVTFEDVRRVSPALETYTKDTLLGGLWKRPGLSPRDRSLVTVAALIARNQTIEMPYHFNLALDNGVTPGELSEVITHLAFYSGWANATAAVAVAKDVFDARHIGSDQLPTVDGVRLPLDEAAEAQRAARVAEDVGPVAAGLEQYTTDVLFRDLWLRSALAARDRSLVTVSALIALGHVAQIPYHLNRAMDNGLTKTEASEVLTHLAFYAGWPNAFSAVTVAKGVFDKRPH